LKFHKKVGVVSHRLSKSAKALHKGLIKAASKKSKSPKVHIDYEPIQYNYYKKSKIFGGEK